jgi:hypothetical protein
MQIIREAALTLLSAAMLCTAPEPGTPAEKGTRLWAAISVSRPVVDWDVWTVDPFIFFFGLVNDGDKAVDPDLDNARLLVNGKELANWPSRGIIGPRDGRRWKSLPVGDDIAFGENMSKYFQEPGIYRVVWKGKEFQSPEVVFRVLPRKK